MEKIIVIGAGLAGSEAAWQIARRGLKVRLYEMRPQKNTPAHKTGYFGELICSNSLRAKALENAVGLLKEEMRQMNSLVMTCAAATEVPAGGALAVDRESFAQMLTQKLEDEPLIEIIREEVEEIPAEPRVIIASGPLTSDKLAAKIRNFGGREYFYFYDAVAPIVTRESLDLEKIFFSSRYDKGEGCYLNCPFDKKEYLQFYEALCSAEQAPRHHFDAMKHFEGCMPIEALAARGIDTMRYGPLKPVGLTDPRTGRWPYAVVQLRQDNAAGSLYNLVGFQTGLTWKAQKEVFSLIPGLEQAEFVRYGVMHRNTYLNSPVLLNPTYESKSRQGLFFAGQITGVEGYVESAASGLVAGINAVRRMQGKSLLIFPSETALGALAAYITQADPQNFQPMNVAFGLFPPLEQAERDKKKRKSLMAARALASLASFCSEQVIK